MKLSKYSRAIPNRKIFHEPANSEVTTYRLSAEEIAKRYPKG